MLDHGKRIQQLEAQVQELETQVRDLENLLNTRSQEFQMRIEDLHNQLAAVTAFVAARGGVIFSEAEMVGKLAEKVTQMDRASTASTGEAVERIVSARYEWMRLRIGLPKPWRVWGIPEGR